MSTPAITFRPYEPGPQDPDLADKLEEELRVSAGNYARLGPTPDKWENLKDAAVNYTLASSPVMPKTLDDVPRYVACVSTDGDIVWADDDFCVYVAKDGKIETQNIPDPLDAIGITRVLGFPEVTV